MNINKFTIKSQEALQQAQQIAQSLEHQHLENEHIFEESNSLEGYCLMSTPWRWRGRATHLNPLLRENIVSVPRMSLLQSVFARMRTNCCGIHIGEHKIQI